MEWYIALSILMGGVCVLLFLGLPVALAFLAVNVAGAIIFLGGAKALISFPSECLEAVAKFNLTPIPLFILMGEMLFHTGVAFRAIDAVDRLIVRVPGRLSVVSLFGGTIFASLSGSTIASTAMIGNTLLPRMMKAGYDKKISMGPIMAVGGIDMLIPPSALAVLLASLAERSVAALLVAGIVPGLAMAAIFIGYVVVRCYLNPALAPAGDIDVRRKAEWLPMLVYVVPLLSIFIVVVATMFWGIASPTEAAALGCVATGAVCACYRALTLRNLMTAAIETAKISVMILFIIAGSLTFAQLLAISGGTNGLLVQLKDFDLSNLALVLVMVGILLVLGCFMDQISMILLTLPFFIPLALSQQIDVTWLLLLTLVAMELSLLTPPFGLLLFVMKGVAPSNVTLMDVYAAALPFVVMKLLILALLIAWPEFGLWLPRKVL
ncbi:TRAP transporter large permease [Bradyrhizobium sp.]|uniref:TRAP transporter large permease n=1 Tax=Bradyrhizobium sp. TaxID=376 RepID=UPI0040376D5C